VTSQGRKYAYACVCVCVCVYIYIYTHTHTDSVLVFLGIRLVSSIGENASCIAFKILGLRLGLVKRLGFMSGLTLPAAVATQYDSELGSSVASWRPPLAKLTGSRSKSRFTILVDLLCNWSF